jgi:hypothetical protein
MFALVIERDPLKLADLPAGVQGWVQDAGGFAALGLAIWLLVTLLRGGKSSAADERSWSAGKWLACILLGGAVVAVLPLAMLKLWDKLGWIEPPDPSSELPTQAQTISSLYSAPYSQLLIFYGASCAVVAVMLPVLVRLGRLRWRRIWALAKLSFKEAVRRRVLWGFSALLLVFLFASWFLPYRPDSQVRNYVRAVYWTMSPLLLATAGLLAAFSIPADLRSQTMHTIVTKPVERFEIILGRFLGYALLMSLVLVVMTGFSLIYVVRGVNQEAAYESLKARKPVWGDLEMIGPPDRPKGLSVGYEWEYRKYITGAAKNEMAIWTFRDLPASLANRETVRCEFTFHIFRTTKGEENKGIFCTFIFENAKAQSATPGTPIGLDQYHDERKKQLPRPELLARAQQEGWPEEKTLALAGDALAEKYGIYELPSKEVTDFHTQFVDLPAGLFKGLGSGDHRPEQGADTPRAPLRVVVRCDSPTQYLGMAKYDLYLRADGEEGAGQDLSGFSLNFFKGAIGLWYRLCLVIGLAVTCSTYLSGVISFLTTMFLYLTGLVVDFIRTVAEGKSLGGGPLEALLHITTRSHPAFPMDPSPAVNAAVVLDKGFEWLLRRFLNMIPDVERFDLTDHVAEGFDISAPQLLMTGLLLAGYLLPWAVLAYYLMRSREIAA